MVVAPFPQREGESALTLTNLRGRGSEGIWLLARFRLLQELPAERLVLRHPGFSAGRQRAGLGAQPRKAPASNALAQVWWQPLPPRPEPRLCRLQGHGGGAGKRKPQTLPPGGRTGPSLRHPRWPLPRGGPSPRWLGVDKDGKMCKMATKSRAGQERRLASGQLPSKGIPNPACNSQGPGVRSPQCGLEHPQRPLFLTSCKHKVGKGAL